MKIKLNADLRGYKKGEVVIVEETNYEDVIYWQRRLQEAEIDKCCELLKDAKDVKAKTENKTK